MPLPELDNAWGHVASWLTNLAEDGPDLITDARKKTVHEAIELRDDPCLDEWADVFMTLVGAALAEGWTQGQCADAVLNKVFVNLERTWVRQPDGTWQHA